MLTATYSPEDNKLRIYSLSRLSREVYDRVKAAGFKWAPKQELFVAPMWTPDREDLLVELCGEIGDEDTSLVDRAEQRAERFEDYGEKRFQDAERAHAAVHAIADGIPLGQPILVGHHSERHARRDAEKIERGMRRAVKMWETSKYWEARARGAMSHAKYKELPAVRYRRIKTIEADKRKAEKECAEALAFMKAFRAVCPITWEAAKRIANDGRLHYYRRYPLADFPRNPPASQCEGEMSIWSALGDTPEEAIVSPAWARLAVGRRAVRIVRRYRRWIRHYENRLAYERAMLGEQGGTAAERYDLQPGGQVLAEGLWLTVVRVNKSGGSVSSVSTNNRSWPRVVSVERIRDYRPPTEELAGKVKTATTLAPICNYPGEGFYPITQAQWDAEGRDYKRTANRKATETTAAHRVRVMDNFRLRSFGHVIQDQWGSSPVFMTDAKRKDPPAMTGAKPATRSDLPIGHDLPTLEARAERREAAQEVQAEQAAEAAPFVQMKESLRAGGVKVTRPRNSSRRPRPSPVASSNWPTSSRA